MIDNIKHILLTLFIHLSLISYSQDSAIIIGSDEVGDSILINIPPDVLAREGGLSDAKNFQNSNLEEIEESVFLNFEASNFLSNAGFGLEKDADILVAHAHVVKRKNDSLVFKINYKNNSKSLSFVDKGASDNENYKKYYYRGLSSQIQQYIVVQWLYEGISFILIDPETGLVTNVSEEPFISPSGKYFICKNRVYNDDYKVSYDLELYENVVFKDGSHEPSIIGSKNFDKLSISDMKWYNDSTLLIATETDSTEGKQTKYYKLTWK